MTDLGLFQQWRALHAPVMKGARLPKVLVRLHCTDVPDAIPCTIDGVCWGQLLTRELPTKVGSGVGLVRVFRADGQPDRVMGLGFEGEHVFMAKADFDTLRAAGETPWPS